MQKNGAQLILVQVPSQTTWTYARHNAVNDYAKKNGIPFLDLDLKRKEIGFSWKTDSRDAGNHLNCYGAKKYRSMWGSTLRTMCSWRISAKMQHTPGGTMTTPPTSST